MKLRFFGPSMALMFATIGSGAFAQANGEATSASTIPYFASNCFNCHGTDGLSKVAIPSLAGKNKALFIEQMKGFKTGTLAASIMPQLAKGYTDEEIEVLADFFAQQTP